MDDFKNDIIPSWSSITGRIDTDVSWWLNLFNSIFVYIKDSIFGLLAIITIGLFIYIWWKLIKADGNPEEMKKAFKNLIYIIIGLFIVSLSFALVKMVSGLNF